MKFDQAIRYWEKELKVYVIENFEINILDLQIAFQQNILEKFLPVWQESYRFDQNRIRKIPINRSRDFTFGGWSLLSENGDYTDGWIPDGTWKNLTISKINDQLHNKKTQCCFGIFDDIVNKLIEMKLNPCRMRITISKSNHDIAWHSDTLDDSLFIRLHIPIITNSTVRLVSENKKWHLPSNGKAIIFNANKKHKVENFGDNRFHIMATVSIPNDSQLEVSELWPLEEGVFYDKV